MRSKKKAVTIYKVGANAGNVLQRETTEDSLGGKIRKTSFVGIIFDKEEADLICKFLNKKGLKK